MRKRKKRNPRIRSQAMAGTPAAEHWPDEVLEHIFSFLPTRDIVKTCFLGKRWRYYWTTVSHLKFYVTSERDSFVDRVLKRYKSQNQKVKKFHLDIHSKEFCSAKIDSWVAFAIDRQVEELVIDLYFSYAGKWYPISWDGHRLSPLLYNCSSLTSLFLRGCVLPSCGGVSWSSLKSLSITLVNGDVLQKILMGCPVLEYLTLGRCMGVEEIRSMSLRELVIKGSVTESPLHILTPRLLSLIVGVDYSLESLIIIVEAPCLLLAALDFNGSTESGFCLIEEMLCKLQNATRMFFGPWYCRVMQPLKIEDIQVSLPNCKYLLLRVPIPEFSFPAIANMLATVPNLEKLVIGFNLYDHYSVHSLNSNSQNVFDMDSYNVDHKTYWHIKKKFKCWARHLRNVEIFGFYDCLRDKYEEVLTLIKFLLGHAFVLENIVMKLWEGLEYPEVISSDKLHEVIRQLKCYHKASEHAAVILNYLEEEHAKRPNKGIKVTTKSMRI